MSRGWILIYLFIKNKETTHKEKKTPAFYISFESHLRREEKHGDAQWER